MTQWISCECVEACYLLSCFFMDPAYMLADVGLRVCCHAAEQHLQGLRGVQAGLRALPAQAAGICAVGDGDVRDDGLRRHSRFSCCFGLITSAATGRRRSSRWRR